jgi:hypothetical protein
MNHTKFAVSRFENRNGVTSWRVDGRLHGVRFRKNFKTREEAAAEKAALELKALSSRLRAKTIKTRYRLTRRGCRGDTLYCVDSRTGKRSSLHTSTMSVVGEELTIRLETATASGEPIVRTLRWKRVG